MQARAHAHTHAHAHTLCPAPGSFPLNLKLKLAFAFIIHISSLSHSHTHSIPHSYTQKTFTLGVLFYRRHQHTKIIKPGEWSGDSMFGASGWTLWNCQYWAISDLHNGHFIWFSLIVFMYAHTYFRVHSNTELLSKTEILSLDLLFTSLGNFSKLELNSFKPHFLHVKWKS